MFLERLQSSPGINKALSRDYSNPDLPEIQLWAAFTNGKEDAFIQLYNEYANVLFNYGCQFSGDSEMTKDCLQDFFIYLRKNRSGFKEITYVKSYLLKAFRRRVLDYVKKYKKECRNNEALLSLEFPAELSSEALYINRQLEDEQIRSLNTALNALDRKEREAIYLFYYEGLGYEQIAEIFQFTHVSSARRLVYRALGRLRKVVRPLFKKIAGDCIAFRLSCLPTRASRRSEPAEDGNHWYI